MCGKEIEKPGVGSGESGKQWLFLCQVSDPEKGQAVNTIQEKLEMVRYLVTESEKIYMMCVGKKQSLVDSVSYCGKPKMSLHFPVHEFPKQYLHFTF